MICISRYLFFYSIFLLPFDGIRGINIFGGISSYGFFYPSLIGMLLFYFDSYNKGLKVFIPRGKEVYLLLLFIAYLPLTEILNCQEILLNSMKDSKALLRVVLPYLVVLFMFFLLPYYFNVIRNKKNIYIKLYNYLKNGFYLTGVYSFFQILFLFNNDIGKKVVQTIHPYISGVDVAVKIWRINGLSLEPSTFGVYLSFVFPWILGFNLFINSSIKGMFLCMYAICILIFSFSRTAYVVFFIEIFLIIYLFRKEIFTKMYINKMNYLLYVVLVVFIFGIFFVSQWSVENIGFSVSDVYLSILSKNNNSNIARLGTQVAAFNMFLEYPFFGVGYGQYTFHVAEYMPNWAYAAQEIVDRLSNIESDVPIFSLYARILGETGIIGIAIWGGIILTILNKLLNIRKRVNEKDIKIVNIILVSYIGTIISFNNFDSFSILGFWLTIVLVWITEEKISKKENLL